MHGIIFTELKKYANTKYGEDIWNRLLKESGIKPKIYLPVQEYPDEEIVAIVSTVSRITEKPINAILEDFGFFITQDLIGLYSTLIRPEWKMLDFLQHTEETIHRVVRLKSPGAKPPELECTRPYPDEVIITYSSRRKMCALAIGIIRGTAKHYKERVTISEISCMQRGDPNCKISVKLEK
jgi:hypothetical protein